MCCKWVLWWQLVRLKPTEGDSIRKCCIFIETSMTRLRSSTSSWESPCLQDNLLPNIGRRPAMSVVTPLDLPDYM